MTEFDWQEAFKLKPGLVQRDLVSFERVLFNLERSGVLARYSNITAQAALCAAIEAGWIETPASEVGDFKGEKRYYLDGVWVDEMHPGKVRWYGAQIETHHNDLVQPPKN